MWTDDLQGIAPLDPKWDPIRESMGYTRQIAERMNLARAMPRGDLVSTGYCLADPGAEYLAYLPEGGDVTVDLSAASGRVQVEWLNPSTGETTAGAAVTGGATVTVTAPFGGDAVVYLHSTDARQKP